MPTVNPINIFPARRIKPFDGMAVTAETWNTDHHELRSSRKAHDLAFHGSGIITGLEVLANDPPDRMVFISPGAAVDPEGNIIVLPERVAYDFGSSIDGQLSLYISHGEREVAGSEPDSVMIQSEYVVSARSEAPKKPSVELARITLKNGSDPIRVPSNPNHPTAGELDQRFRSLVGAAPRRQVRIALCEMTNSEKELQGSWDMMLGAANATSRTEYVLDMGVMISPDLAQYALVVLTGRGAFHLTDEQISQLKQYLERGGKLLAEGLDASANLTFAQMFEKLGVGFGNAAMSNSLTKFPFFFPSPFSGPFGAELLLAPGIIFSKAGHSLGWGGYPETQQPTRELIRSAHEWAENMLATLVGMP